MFDQLTERLTKAFKNITGQGRFTEENMQTPLQEVRLSLLEADVALPVVKAFIEKVKTKALGQEIDNHLKSNQALIKIIKEELIQIMGEQRVEFNYSTQPPAVCMMAGLQGSGKTTNTAKLARYLKETDKKKVMVVSVDVYRPAAITQLQILAEQIGVDFFPSQTSEDPITIVKNALAHAKKQFIDVLLVDTAGRLHIDDEMMNELKNIHQAINPIETFFVVDAMTGQDAANTAKAFHQALPLTGVILTKTDGDARGGAALSVKYITGQPIKFMSFGEKLESFEAFHPERIASRILGMGDILSLIEEVERKTDKKTSEKLAKKIKKGNGFDLDDFKQQLLQMNQMGGVSSMMSKLPGISNIAQSAKNEVSDKSLAQTVAIINSMTPKERRIPKIIIGSRKRRIALGSGTQIQDVNRLLKRFEQMQKMMQKISKPGGLKNMMRGVQGLPGMNHFLPDD
ncbi:MAG TPA: signal recognition particle protein [Legionellaceae bacterium]|nr:signal recognition particle protein [Legionellaceae bacterium]